MLSLDWTTAALILTVSGLLLIWFRNFKLRGAESSKNSKTDPYDEEQLQKVFNRTVKLLEEEHYYLNKNIKVSDLAKEIHQSEKVVSRSINRYGNGNFNVLINSFRVGYAKKLLVEGNHDHYTIEAIALESGFSNKVSFYNAFKSLTGMSPKEFKAAKHP